MNEFKPKKKKMKTSKNTASSKRHCSPSGSIEKISWTYKQGNEPFGYREHQTNLKMNSLRTKRHLSPKARLTKPKKKIGVPGLNSHRKIIKTTSNSNLNTKQKVTKKKRNLLMPKFAEIDFDKSDYMTQLVSRKNKKKSGPHSRDYMLTTYDRNYHTGMLDIKSFESHSWTYLYWNT